MDSFYRAFEDWHRGSRDLVKSRSEVYLPFILPYKKFQTNTNALDLGCGRGEWLELLKDNGFNARGVDFDDGMLQACKETGLSVVNTDILAYLKKLEDESVDIVSALHVVEHISFDFLRDVVNEIFRVLRSGGILILETPNSENVVVGTSNFYLDPTHIRPIPSGLLNFIVKYSGFERIKTLYLQESPSLLAKNRIDLFSVFSGVSPDYAIVAQKAARSEMLSFFNMPFNRSYGVNLEHLAKSYDNQMLHLEEQLNKFIHIVEKIYKNPVWKFCKSLNKLFCKILNSYLVFKNSVKYLFLKTFGFFKLAYVKLVKKIVLKIIKLICLLILRYPSIKKYLISMISKMPRFKKYCRKLFYASSGDIKQYYCYKPPHNIDNLSSRAIKVYSYLKNNTKNQ